jgi:hypothetical protein
MHCSKKCGPARSFLWAKRSADGGNEEGNFWAGKDLIFGVGTPADPNAAIRYLLQARNVSAVDQYLALAYIKAGDMENAGRYLRTRGDLVPVGEHSAGEWFDILGIPT